MNDQLETRSCDRTKDHPAHRYMTGREVQQCPGKANRPEQPEVCPDVAGRCPACRAASLFLGSGGHVTCARLDCPNPTAADDLLHAPAGTLVTGTLAKPAERCGDMTESITGTGWYECVLRPGHQGSHADHSNMRWAEIPLPTPPDRGPAVAFSPAGSEGPVEPDNPAATALAQHIADHPVSTVQAAFRLLGIQLDFQLSEIKEGLK
ncbi:hypothetical protein ACIQWN_28830 [Streptomyces vinaceus]|uniref:hypothetical protein n=1 Tax=Streptomyces vinaceus TaxID=1960 RepID=UPI00382A6FCA